MRLRGPAFRAFCWQPPPDSGPALVCIQRNPAARAGGAPASSQRGRGDTGVVSLEAALPAMPNPPEGPLENSRTPCCFPWALRRREAASQHRAPACRLWEKCPWSLLKVGWNLTRTGRELSTRVAEREAESLQGSLTLFDGKPQITNKRGWGGIYI